MSGEPDQELASPPMAPSLARWRSRARQSPEDRRRILEALFPVSDDAPHWWFRFTVMMALSVVVAVMGLSENSAAVVIGAMLIAPLMTPVLGVSASVAMAWPSRFLRSLGAVVVGSIGAVGLAYVLTAILPGADKTLTNEVLARTSPDLRDLLIGLAAGAAGAYATVRDDVAAALPGVAVAVALVPPLAVVGYSLAIGQTELALGALLLYATNLAAIVLAGTAVFLSAGFVPSGRLRLAVWKIRVGVLAVVVALVGVSIPLTIRTVQVADHARTERLANQALVSWLSADPGLTLGSVTITKRLVTVDVIGSDKPPPSAVLLHSLSGILGSDAAVDVRWFRSG